MLSRVARKERDALEDWIEEYTAVPVEDRLRARADKARAEILLTRARLYYQVLLDYWSKLADPRDVSFKGVWQIASETADAQSLMHTIQLNEAERRRTEGKAG